MHPLYGILLSSENLVFSPMLREPIMNGLFSLQFSAEDIVKRVRVRTLAFNNDNSFSEFA